MLKLKKGTNQTVNSIVTAVGMITAVLLGMTGEDGAQLTTYLGMVASGGIGTYFLVKSYVDEKKDEKEIKRLKGE